MTLHAVRPHGPRTEVEHPRDVDPSITGQPHQVTGNAPDLMGIYRGRLVTRRKCQRRYRFRYRRNSFHPTLMAMAPGADSSPLPGARANAGEPSGRVGPRRIRQAAPRWSASQTAVDSRTPSSTARPQCAIQAAIPSGVPAR